MANTSRVNSLTRKAIEFLLLVFGFATSSSETLAALKNNDLQGFQIAISEAKGVSDTLDRMQKMENFRGSAQESLERLLKAKPGNTELELRFSELIIQRGKDLEQFSLELEVNGDSKKAAELKANSLKLLRQGLSRHSNLLAKLKNHPMAAKIYLGLARIEYSLGQKGAALKNAELGISRLTKDSNQQDTALQLHMIRGDAAFDLAKAGLALQAYTDAIALAAQGSMELAYLHYKLSWTKYNLKDSETALSHLDELFKIAGDKYALRQEAVQDFALFMADLPNDLIEKRGGFAGVLNYLEKNSDAQGASRALNRMAGVYSKNGRRTDAISLNEFLISERPSAPENMDRALLIVEWSHHLANKTKLTDRYYWLMDYFGPKSAWFKAQSAAPQIQKDAFDRIETSVRTYATKLHEQVQKETRQETRKLNEDVVARLYDAHIQVFNRDSDIPRPEAGRVHFYRAEIHRGRKQWADAGFRYDSFLRILDFFPVDRVGKTDEKIKGEALWSSVEVWAKALESDKKYSGQLLSAADRFLARMPKDSRAPQILLDAAFIESKTGNNPVALKRLDTLIQNYPKTKQTQLAVETTLDILNKESDWVNLAVSARRYMDTIDKWVLATEKVKTSAQLKKILSQTEAKACEALNQQKDKKIEAALCFESYARGFDQDLQAPSALYLAYEIYDELKDPSAAVTVLERLVKKYPNSPQALTGFAKLAAVYEKSFSFEKATEVYETLLSKNAKLAEREKILTRLLDLYSSMGQDKKFETWLAKKDTPASVKSDFATRKRFANLILLRQEEIRWGWTKGDLKSSKAQGVVREFENLKKSGKINSEELLELSRITGIRLRESGDLEKADKEWMAGLKHYWSVKDKTPQVKETAARIRLEQGSIWDNMFRRIDILKNPGKKAELFKKVENWYAEVIEMGAPAVALEALWKTAEVNIAFAESVRQSPIPPELMAPELESQRATYKKLVIEKTEPLKKKAISIIEKIAIKAREWKVITPSVLASLKVTAQIQAGVELPGTLVSVDESTVLKFPWLELPRWMDLNSDQLKWEEWSFSEASLRKSVAQELGRSASRRAAFVLMARHLDFQKDPNVAKWIPVFNDRAGVQLRIQGFVNTGDMDRAILYLEQYESFFGSDAFAEHYWGKIEWDRGNYSTAYLKWVRPSNPDSLRDFRSVYWSEGWAFLLDEMIEGWPSASRRKEVFSKLAPLSKGVWQDQYIAKLCVENAAVCEAKFAGSQLIETLTSPIESFQAWRLEDQKSSWDARRLALAEFTKRQTPQAQLSPDFEILRKALTAYYGLFNLADNPKTAQKEYGVLKKLVDQRQDFIDFQNNQKIFTADTQKLNSTEVKQ